MKRFILVMSICLCAVTTMAQSTLSFAYGTFEIDKPERVKREHKKPFIGLHFGVGATEFMDMSYKPYYDSNDPIWRSDPYYNHGVRNVTNGFNFGTPDAILGLDMAFHITDKFAMGMYINYQTVSQLVFGPLFVFGDYDAGRAWILGLGADFIMGCEDIKIRRRVTYEYDTNYEQNKYLSDSERSNLANWETTTGRMEICPFYGYDDYFVGSCFQIRFGRQISPKWYVTGFANLGRTANYAHSFGIRDIYANWHSTRGGGGFVWGFGVTTGYRFAAKKN